MTIHPSRLFRLFREIVELEKSLRDLLRNVPSNHEQIAKLRATLMGKSTSLVLSNPEFASSKEIEQMMWKPCFYKRIEEFRVQIRQYAAASTTDRSARDRFARVSVEFQDFLMQASLYYESFCCAFQQHAQIPSLTTTRNRDGVKVEGQKVPGKAGPTILGRESPSQPEVITQPSVNCRRSLYRCLIFLGDLARYRELHSRNAKKNFANAEEFYHDALRVFPENGNPHNQLAVLATYVDAETVAVYRYCRSLLIANPFTTAEENLVLLFERSRQQPLAPPSITRLTMNLSANEKFPYLKSFLHRLTRLHGFLYSNATGQVQNTISSTANSAPKVSYSREMESILLKDLKPLLEVRMIGEALLLKIVGINIFSIVKSTDTKAANDALRLCISLMACVAEYVSNEVEKLTQENFVSSLRLLGPLSVFCDYLKSNSAVLDKLEITMNSKSGERDVTAGNYIKRFFETLAMLINNPKLKVYDSTSLHQKMFQLKENVELRGFLPLVKLYDPSSVHWKLNEPIPTRDRASSPSPVTYLTDKEAFKIRAWNLFKFCTYLCEEYEGNPLLYSNNGLFLVSPATVASNISTANSNSADSMAPVLPANVLNIFNENLSLKAPASSFEAEFSPSKSLVGQDEEDLDDEVIVFQPAAPSPQTAPLSALVGDNDNPSHIMSSFASSDTFPDPFSSLCVGSATHSSGSTASTSSFSRFRGGNISSGGLPSSNGAMHLSNFHSFGNFEGLSNITSSDNTWGDSKRVATPIRNESDRDRVLNSSLTKANTAPTSDPMDDLAAIERHTSRFQQKESSLNSLFNGSTGSSSLFSTVGPSASRAPRPPPGFMSSQSDSRNTSPIDARLLPFGSPDPSASDRSLVRDT
uniref:Uncharacterized protein AlNc14C116G6550 n=1 Tax=Albugo laibachii Nc14 TaxID=890382 RepID=F0WJ17_9STRA|nr:conserved hypothetical protein [Albugo laibachii Nc14]|eukprot:CCA21263.1 conserved hypothetical protein [Albugo laibachii Nc14]